MSEPGPLSERAIVLAPSGRDGPLAVSILQRAGFPAEGCNDLTALHHEIGKGAGLALIADEALRGVDIAPIAEVLRAQPPWSDFPVILLTQRGGGPERNPVAARLAELLGNVTFLERPFHPTTLVSVVRTAVRGRRRQYDARSRLIELYENEQQLQTALRAGNLGSWTLDITTMALRASDSCKAHFGRLPKDPLTYDDVIEAIHPDDRERMRSAVEHSLRTGENYSIEYRIVWPDGSLRWMDVRARVLRSSTGVIEQMIGVSSDITPRKTSELEREQLLAQLAAERATLSDLTATLEQRVRERTDALMTEVAARERAQVQLLQAQKMESIGQLTGGVAHDFNNLLAAVMGNLELLRKRLPDDPRLDRLIDGAMQGARRGAALTQRMLAFARQQDLKTGSADLGELLTGMRDLLDRTLGPEVSLTFDIPDHLPPAQVDANQIELATLNLAINARDAMPDGGGIDISVSLAAKVHPDLAPGQYLKLQIVDSGVGMDEPTLKKAIEPFFSTKPVGKGTGLGLSMVHGLAEQLGGLLELSSVPEKGTTATLWLPVAAPAAIAEAAAPAPVLPEEAGRSATILVVDDDPLIARSTAEMLADLGHIVVEANSGREALDILESGLGVDLIVTDHAMPGMNGIELAAAVHRSRPGMPVLLATGYVELPVQATGLPRLAKPYEQAALKAHIDHLLASA
ncbi:PAS domain-containing protein [Emcibacter sp. SYSU 3D8]|uniref:PAS domain-containing protein n=1 Tax=Emcibacter sp. SYSU 3D8 TaxID=3133969 RepID=UPI0031FE4829